MARARNIKPGFFKNEDLGLLPIGARMLFVGLWTLADREGRMEDRPARIAAEIFPYDREISVQVVSEWINLLAGFVTRYTANGSKFLAINNFTKHQTPHVKEQASTIPAPDLHQTCTVQVPDMPLPTQLLAPPDSLNPSSLNPDSLIPDITPTGVKGVKALTPHQIEMKRLKDLGWKGVAKTTDAACEKIIVTIRESDFAPSSDLKSAYMIFTRLCWFVEFAGYFWECGAGPDQRRAREMYFEMVPDLETKELVESAIEAQAPAMLEREKKFRTQPHNWLKSRSWEAAGTLFGQ